MICLADVSAAFAGYIAIDDVELIIGECPATKYCDFEVDFCGFQNDLKNDVNWVRINNINVVKINGPIVDHTYQTDEGYYASVDAKTDFSKSKFIYYFEIDFKQLKLIKTN
jgi:hypothetical protein